MGLDSGVERTGYAIVNHHVPDAKLISYGCIFTEKKHSASDRIKLLGSELGKLIDTHKPSILVIEQLFFNSNKKTVIGVAQAQGVTMYVGAQKKCQIEFLTPLQIKQTLTGYGRADKKQVEKMLKIILEIDTLPKPDDTTDAIACALAFCTLYNFNSKVKGLI